MLSICLPMSFRLVYTFGHLWRAKVPPMRSQMAHRGYCIQFQKSSASTNCVYQALSSLLCVQAWQQGYTACTAKIQWYYTLAILDLAHLHLYLHIRCLLIGFPVSNSLRSWMAWMIGDLGCIAMTVMMGM